MKIGKLNPQLSMSSLVCLQTCIEGSVKKLKFSSCMIFFFRNKLNFDSKYTIGGDHYPTN